MQKDYSGKNYIKIQVRWEKKVKKESFISFYSIDFKKFVAKTEILCP